MNSALFKQRALTYAIDAGLAAPKGLIIGGLAGGVVTKITDDDFSSGFNTGAKIGMGITVGKSVLNNASHDLMVAGLMTKGMGHG